MAETNLTMTSNIDVNPREIDFVTRFGLTWQAFIDIVGIMRPIRKAAGTKLISKYAEVTLNDGNVGEGEKIPLSQAEVKTKEYKTISLMKYAKEVTAEAIDANGYDIAVAMTDDQFLYELQSKIMKEFYNYLKTGELTATVSGFQAGLAMAQGYVINRFKEMNRVATKIVGFVNVLDVYSYLGSASISVQNQFGFNYIKNFMGFDTIFLCSEDQIPSGTIIALPVENIVMYYVDPSQSDFSRAGLQYTVDGVTPLIGFHTQGDYDYMTSKCYATYAVTLFAEYLDGIAVISTGDNNAMPTSVKKTSTLKA